LEIEAEEVAQRYYQALFGMSKREDRNQVSRLKFNDRGELDQIVTETVDVPFTFASESIREELDTRLSWHARRAENVVIKRFPMSSLTVDQLEAYLEHLEVVEHFVPDLLIVDYPKIMKLDPKNTRTSLGRTMEELRGMSQRRNFALVAVHQGNRDSMTANLVRLIHSGEDISVIQTADVAVTYSQTEAEHRLGLARLFVGKGRSEADQFGVLITQTYKTGQFVLESTRLSDAYVRLMEDMGIDDDSPIETDGSDST
jgi:hypothetical protein